MERYWKISVISLIVTLLFPIVGFNQNVVSAAENLEIEAKSAILVDAFSGKIFYSKDIDIPLPPASMTKMMTEYLVLEAVNSGEIKWDDIVTASDYAHWLGKNGGSRVFLGLGEKRTVEELMYAMAVYSANDATVALTEYISGSESNFVNMMNKKAEEFEMNQTYFLNSTGYPADELGEFAPNINGDHLMSARDAALLGWHLINDFPESLNFTSTSKLKFRKEKEEPMILPNWNWMLPGLIYEYPGVDGLKTGYTEQAGYNFTATASKNGIRLISVVLGTTSQKERFLQTKKILDYGFKNYEVVDLIKAKEPVPGFETIEVEKGKEKEVSVITKNDLSILIKRDEQELYKPVIVLDEVLAPIKSEDIIGKVTYSYQGKEQYDYLNDYTKSYEEVSLIANEDVEKASSFRLFFRKIVDMISAIYTAIIDGIKSLF